MMVQPLRPSELSSNAAYEAVRTEVRRMMVALARLRRVSLGPLVSLVFLDRNIIKCQLQEIVRTEGIASPRVLQDECDTYSALLPNEDELSAAMVIESPAMTGGGSLLCRLDGIEERTCLVVGGARIAARRMADEDSVTAPSVTRHLRFHCSERDRHRLRDTSLPMHVEIDHPAYAARADLTPEKRLWIIKDLFHELDAALSPKLPLRSLTRPLRPTPQEIARLGMALSSARRVAAFSK